MRVYLLAAIFVASACWAQEAAPNPPSPSAAPAPAASGKQTLTVPAGTRVPLSLTSPIRVKSARPGTAVRAVTGFPVTVGTELAIPTGTYVEGAIDKVTKGGRTGPALQMHFTRIVFASGYSVAIEGANVVAQVGNPREGSSAQTAPSGGTGPVNGTAASSARGLNPLPGTGQSVATAAGIAAGATVAAIVTAVLLSHRHGGGANAVVFDTGWQFEMVLAAPLTVDVASVSAAPVAH